MSVVTHADVAELARCRKLLPRETDFIDKPGYKRTYRKDGSYTWRCRFKPNDGAGKLTREAAEVGERMKPFVEADTARVISKPVPVRAVLRDREGGLRYVDPALAADTARQRGWSHAWRAGGCRVERGIDGELWRELPDGTREPTGRWCLTVPQPWAAVPEGGNPDGTMRP